MSKLQEQLRAKGIYNDYEIVRNGHKIFVYYSPLQTGLASVANPSGWYVQATNRKLEKNSFSGAKHFWGKGDQNRFEYLESTVLPYAASLCGETEWARSPFGGYVPVADLERVGIKPKKIIKVVKSGGTD